jgi:hypothetical protein
VHCYLLEGVIFWRIWTSGIVLVEVVLQLQGIDHCSETLLLFSSSFFCFRAMCIRNAIRALLLQRLDAIGIFVILIYILYQEMQDAYRMLGLHFPFEKGRENRRRKYRL